MKEAYTWAAIGLIVLASTTGDVLLSHAMKRVGDVGELWKRHGLLQVIGRVLATPTFFLGLIAMGSRFLQPALCSLLGRPEPGRPGFRFAHVRGQRRSRLGFFFTRRVGRRRLLAALLVAGGVALMAI